MVRTLNVDNDRVRVIHNPEEDVLGLFVQHNRGANGETQRVWQVTRLGVILATDAVAQARWPWVFRIRELYYRRY